MSCLPDELISAWLDGELADHERAGAIDHASGCDQCRELLGAVFDRDREPVMIGRYEIVGTIGGGGMGVVLRGRDPVLDRSVAIKLARADIVGEMLREAQALARLSHPNVVAVHDFGESGGEVFVAMALAEGVPLSRWLAEAHNWAERLRVLDGVAAGLAAIHDAGLVHRDIKPDNIVVSATGEASIVDFGLARPSAAGAVGTGVAGTRDYIAPEVLAGAAASPASDQYAWWILVGELLKGLPPHPRIDAVRARGTSKRFPDMRAAATALRGACAPRWRVPVAVALAACVVAATAIAFAGPRDEDDPCAWSPSYDRAALETGLRAAGADAAHVLAVIDHRATTTAKLRRDACRLARRDGANDRATGQYRLACVDRTWAEASSYFSALSARDRTGVWMALDELGLVPSPERCARSSRATAAAPPVDPDPAVSRLRSDLFAITRGDRFDTATRLAKIDALEPAILATKHLPLIARWHEMRATELFGLRRVRESTAALERSDLFAEASGDDELRTEIAITRLEHAYASGNHDTEALEERARALVDKLDSPIRRAQLAAGRGILQAARGDVTAAVASQREALAFYGELSLGASDHELKALQNLGVTLQMAGELDESLRMFDRGLAIVMRRCGEHSANTLEMRGARATNLLAAHRVEEARHELTQVLEGLLELKGPGDASVGMARLG